jgi:hypothetical protein
LGGGGGCQEYKKRGCGGFKGMHRW